jgi:PAS domain S-box-containing protein
MGKLQKNEMRFRVLTESSPLGIYEVDANGLCVYVNPKWCEMAGMTLSEALGTGWLRGIYFEDRERISKQWNEHVETQKQWDFEYRFCTPQGKITWVAGSDVVLLDERGQVTGYMGSNLDITERKMAEERSKEYSERFRIMFDSIPQLAWIAYPDGFVFSYNKRWYEYTGTTQEQMEGWGWQSVIDAEMFPNVLGQWKEAIATSQPFEMEFPLRGGDGKFRWFLTQISPLKDSRGRVVRWFGTNTDISESKQIEEQLRLVSERLSLATSAAKIGIWDWDLVSNRLVWNDQMYQLYGITEDAFSGAYEAWEAGLHPDDLISARELGQKAARGEVGYNTVFRVVWPDGSVHHIQAIGQLKRDEEGHPVRMTGTNWDITERKNLEDNLRSAVELRDEFMSIASHELKTPLTALSMQIQLLNEISSSGKALDPAKISDLSKRAYIAIRSLVGLLNDLLDVTRIRVGKLKMVKKEMDLKEVTLKALECFQEETQRKGISVILKAGQPVLGIWDPNRIEQILSNLLSNAIKYGEGKPIEVTIMADYSSNHARIMVKDYGMGVASEMQTKIFERFQRAVSGETISGLGLGLYIVRQIAEAHGGSIRLESEPKNGALFIVELPIRSEKTRLARW